MQHMSHVSVPNGHQPIGGGDGCGRNEHGKATKYAVLCIR